MLLPQSHYPLIVDKTGERCGCACEVVVEELMVDDGERFEEPLMSYSCSCRTTGYQNEDMLGRAGKLRVERGHEERVDMWRIIEGAC